MTRSTWHDLTITTVTPTFLGKFEDGQRGGLIPFPVPSLRGVLAYWLRALAGAYVGEDLTSLREAESAVFGSARSGGTGCPSSIWLRAQMIGVSQYQTDSLGVGFAYLMGSGLREGTARSLKAGTLIRLGVRNTGRPVQADLFLSALWALQTFGGLGARARRGFGTVSVQLPLALPHERFDADWLRRDSPEHLPAVLSCVAASLDELGIPPTKDEAQPSYPHFDVDKKWYLLEPDVAIPNAQRLDKALAWTGETLREFRINSDKYANTAAYREIVRPYLDGGTFSAEYRAGALGLPVVYTEKATREHPNERSATVEPIIDGQASRRASPLWLRVGRAAGAPGAWRLRSLAFNAVWLPDPEEALQIRATKGVIRPDKKPVNPPSPEAITDELARWFTHVSAKSSARRTTA